MRTSSTTTGSSRLLGIVSTVVIIATIYFGRVIFVPLALASLFALLLTPVVTFLERLKFPRVIAILLVVIVLLGLVVLIGWQTSQQFSNLTAELPTYTKTLQDKIGSLKGFGSHGLNNASNTVKELEKEIVTAAPGVPSGGETKKAPPSLGSSQTQPVAVEVVPPTNPLEYVENLFGPLATVLVVVIFTIFILVGREDLRNRLIRLAGRGRLNVVTQAIDEATQRINRYLFLQFIVNSGYGLIVAIALHFIGVPNAALWGVTATILRFLPYVGPPLAALMPLLLSLAVFPGWQRALETLGLFVVLELMVSNFVEPLLYGNHLGLSPLAILVSAVFWTLIWGLPGLLLSTPLTVCLVVMGRYIPSLSYLNILLGDEPVLSPHALYYQRLLAADQDEARRVLNQYLKEKSLEELYGSVVIPALSLAEQDRHRNELDEETQSFIYQSTREIIEDLGDVPVERQNAGVGETFSETYAIGGEERGRIQVLCIPARDHADEIVGMLLAQLLERQGNIAQTLQIGTIAEMLIQVSESNPRMVCISALPPFAIEHTRTLYAKLHAHSPKLQIVVCLWNFEGDLQKVAIRLKLRTEHKLFTILPKILEYIASLTNKIECRPLEL